MIVAVGGQSYPGCGTTGDGYAIARRFGHSIVATRPALVPIRVDADWVPGLKGLTLPDVVASVHGPGGPALIERREAVLFAHFGLTGPAILDVSRASPATTGDGRLELVPRLRPRRPPGGPRRPAPGRLPRSAASRSPASSPRASPGAWPRPCSPPRGSPPTGWGRTSRATSGARLVASLKGLRLPIAGTLGFAKAEVTSGGVALDEVDPRTLESRLQPGLHFVGEVLDLDGLIGGYNFQAAWSTGWLAGESVASG